MQIYVKGEIDKSNARTLNFDASDVRGLQAIG